MQIIGPEPCPLPDDPVLAATSAASDRDWRALNITDEAGWMYGVKVELAPFPLDGHVAGPERVSMAMEWRGGQFPLEIHRRFFAMYGPWILADTPGGREELRALVDPRLEDIVDDLEPVEVPPAATLRFQGIYTGAGARVETLTNMPRNTLPRAAPERSDPSRARRCAAAFMGRRRMSWRRAACRWCAANVDSVSACRVAGAFRAPRS